MQHNLARALNAIRQGTRWRIRWAWRLPANAAMQTDTKRPGARGIVVGGNLDDVVEREAVIFGWQIDPAGLLLRIRSSGLEPRANLFDAGAGRHHLFRGLVGTSLVIRVPEGAHRAIEPGRRCGRLRGDDDAGEGHDSSQKQAIHADILRA